MATFQVPVALVAPDATGNAYPALYAGTTNRQVVPAFVKDVDGSWFGHVRVPQNYVSTAKIIVAIFANATTGVSRLTMSTVKAADGATYNGSFTAETAQDITVPATAYLRKDVTFPASGSLATALVVGDDLLIKLDHNGTHANDTVAVDTLVMEIVLQYADV